MIEDIKFMGSSIVGSKGQIVIPQKVRERLKIKTGDSLVILSTGKNYGFMAVKPEIFDQIIIKVTKKFENLERLRKNAKKI